MHTLHYFSGEAVHSKTLTAHPANSFGELVRNLTDTPQVLPVTYEQFHKLPKAKQRKIKCTHYLTPCTFPETPWTGGRTNENARACNLIFIDIDNHQDAARLIHPPELLRESLPGINFLAYRTASSTKDTPRLRVVVEAQSIPPARYAAAVRTIAKRLGIKKLTPESEIVCQPMFVPCLFKEQDMDWDDPVIAFRLDGHAFTEADIEESHTFDSDVTQDDNTEDTGGLENLRMPEGDINMELARGALRHLSPDKDYFGWVEKGMQLKHQFGDEGFETWNEWSQRGDLYAGEEATWEKWSKFEATPKGRKPTTIRSLLWEARAAGWIDPRKAANGQVNAADQDSLLVKLDKRRLHLSEPPPRPVTVYSLAGQQLGTAGNLTVISAQAKAGKTAVMGALLASVLGAENEAKGDYLGFTAAPHNGKAVIYFDTEQATYDAWTLLQRAAVRATCETWPENFRFYSLADVGTPERRKMLKLELERAEQQCGGIHSVFIDGVADLCLDPNDTAESFGLVEDLQRLAIGHSCPLITVLHENPSGAETGKTRGHLGSQLERKAESNLRVFKDAKGICTIYSERCRRASIPKDEGPRFTFDVQAGMHLTYHGDAQEEKQEEKRQQHQSLVDAVFQNAPVHGFIHKDLKKRLLETDSAISDKTARRRIKDWKELGLVQLTPTGKYQKAPSAEEFC